MAEEMGIVVRGNFGKNQKTESKPKSAKPKKEDGFIVLEKAAVKLDKRLKKIQKKLGVGEYTTEDSIKLLQSMLAATTKMLPAAYSVFGKYKNERAVYAWVALNTKIQEIDGTLRSLGDAGNLSEKIRDQILESNFKYMVQHLSGEIAGLKRSMYKRLKKNTSARDQLNSKLDKILESYVSYVAELNTLSSEKLDSFFND